MDNMFEILSNAGIAIIEYGQTTASAIVNTFLTPLGEVFPALLGSSQVADYSLLGLMVGVGLPVYISITIVKYVIGIIT